MTDKECAKRRQSSTLGEARNRLVLAVNLHRLGRFRARCLGKFVDQGIGPQRCFGTCQPVDLTGDYLR
nr:hypothetical protein [Rhizobium leguminosarum]